MATINRLTGKLLVAMPSLKDSFFERAVIVICAHSKEGALGLVVNQPHHIGIGEVMAQIKATWSRRVALPVFVGGPVSPERGFLLYEQPVTIPGALEIIPNRLYMGSSPDLLQYMSSADNSPRFLLALGYAGWGPGQLEGELRANSWLVCEVNSRLLFEVSPAERWRSALQCLGIKPAQLVDVGGAAN